MTQSLGELLAVRRSLEDKIEEREGVITEELEVMWNNNEIELAKKIDNYAYVIQHLESVAEMMKNRAAHQTDLKRKAENEIKKIKQRLNVLSQGEKLYGEEYTITPTTSFRSEVDVNKVEPALQRVTLQMSLATWTAIKQLLLGADSNSTRTLVYDITEKGRDVLVTELPKDHPAVTKIPNPTVRIR